MAMRRKADGHAVAAQLMDQLNVGSLPVCDGRRLLGMVTDLDMTVGGTAAGLVPAQARVIEVMSEGVQWCTEDQDTAEVMKTMADAQVRRLPVINGEHELVGIVTVGDIATKAPDPVDAMVREISTPSHPDGGPATS
jgi:CBS-domain-containing membrane protein